MNKLLTIIIPTYNMENYLSTCLDSLIISDEGMAMLEVLIINDGSKDTSSQIAHEYQEKYPNTFRVIDKENGNYGSCINRGLKEATGRYVKVLDADDSFDTANFEQFLSILKEQDTDLVITSFEYVNEKSETIGVRSRNLKTSIDLDFSEVLKEFNTNLISMHELTYRTSIFQNLKYHQTEGISYTDLEWCFLPMTQVRKLRYEKLILYKYLIGREGQTVSDEVAIRAISHKMISGLAMARQFEKEKLQNVCHKEYLERRITWSIGTIYYNYLISYSDLLPLDELILFNNELLVEAPTVYELMNKELLHPLIPLQYIEKWRRQNDLHNIPLSVRMAKSVLSVCYRIKH